MSDVFLAYKRDGDADKAAFIRDHLEKMGISVFQDVDIGLEGHSSDYRDELEKQLTEARAIIVIWTKGAIGSEGRWIRSEADKGYNHGTLVSCSFGLRQQNLPVPFNAMQTPDVTHWFETGRAKGDKACMVFLSVLGRMLDRPGLAALVETLEDGSEEAKRSFLKQFPADPFSNRFWAEISGVERARFSQRQTEVRTRLDKRYNEARKTLAELEKTFTSDLETFRRGGDLSPGDPTSATAAQLATFTAVIDQGRQQVSADRTRAEAAELRIAEMEQERAKQTTAHDLLIAEKDAAITAKTAEIAKIGSRAEAGRRWILPWVCAAAASLLSLGLLIRILSSEATIAEADRRIQEVTVREAALSATRSELSQKEQALASQTAQTEKRQAEVAARQQQLSAQSGEFDRRESALTERAARLDARETGLKTAEAKNAAFERQLADRERALKPSADRPPAAAVPGPSPSPNLQQCDLRAGYRLDSDRKHGTWQEDTANIDVAPALSACRAAFAEATDPVAKRRTALHLGRVLARQATESVLSGDRTKAQDLFNAAADKWAEAARLGSGQAYAVLGSYFAGGFKISQSGERDAFEPAGTPNVRAAVSHYDQAANLQNTQGLVMAAYYKFFPDWFELGTPTAAATERAVRYIRDIREADLPRKDYVVGVATYLGRGYEKNEEEGMRLIKSAACQRDNFAASFVKTKGWPNRCS